MPAPFKIAWRISDRIWSDDTQFEALCSLLLKYPDTADEFALFTAEPSTYGYDPLPRLSNLFEIFKKRAVVLRAAGKSVGINIWPTFGAGGAGDEYLKLKILQPMPFPPVVGMDGSVETSIACPVSEKFLEYSREKFILTAKAAPDFIWVDDDTRFTHLNGVPYPCFCESCVLSFDGGKYKSRDEIVCALNAPENMELRIKWSEYGADRLARYCAEVRKAVDSVDPSIDTPFMTVGPTHTTYSGDFIEKCMTALRSRQGRPGHGFYWDTTPNGMFKKAMEAGRQIVHYPDFTCDILYEEESYPYAYLDKSLQTRINEVWLALTAGCTGVAYNHMPQNCRSGDAKMFRSYMREVQEISLVRPAWETYLKFIQGTKWQGFWPADNEFLMANMNCDNGWFNENTPDYSIDKPEAVLFAGLPLTADRNNACATLLSNKVADTFTDEELRTIFGKGVIMDAQAAQVLAARGLESLTGVLIGDSLSMAWEVLCEHPLNSSFEGYSRYGLFDKGYDLLPINDKVQVLAYNFDAYDNKRGAAITYYENSLGGKVVVCGNSPWNFLGVAQKLNQFSEIAKLMDSPLYIRRPDTMKISRIAPFIRTGEGKAAVLLVNASFDSSEPFELLIKGGMTKAGSINDDGSLNTLVSQREDDRLCVSVPPIKPWETLAVLAE